MIKLFKPGGAISIFLVIILVPCLVVSFLFVDLSRIELSKALVSSSADMALNSLMSHYDIDLNEYYGLVASCQNIEDFYAETEEYFISTLTAAGLGDALTSDIVTFVMNQSAGAADYMQVSAIDDTFTIDCVPDSSLGDSPVLIKEGIVEFMKYRAPYELGKTFINSLLESDTEQLTNTMTDSEEVSDLTDARNTFAETESELNKAEFYTFYYYDKYKKISDFPTKAVLDEIKTKTDDYRSYYNEITHHGIETLWAGGSAVTLRSINANKYYSSAEYDTEKEQRYISSSGVYDNVYQEDVAEDIAEYNSDLDNPVESEAEEVDPIWAVDQSDVDAQIQVVNSKKDALTTLLNDSGFSTYIDMTYGDNPNDYNTCQWYHFATTYINSKIDGIVSAADDLQEELITLKAMKLCKIEVVDPSTGATSVQDSYDPMTTAISEADTVIGYVKSPATASVYSSSSMQWVSASKFNELYSKIKTCLQNNSDLTGKFTYDRTVDASGSSVTSTLQTISSELTTYRAKLQECVDALNIIIDGDSSKNVSSLAEIRTLITQYELDYQGWTSEAYSDDSTIHGENQTEAETEYNLDDLADVAEVQAFEDKLVAIRAEYIQTIEEIDAIMYGSSCIKDISEYSSVQTQINNSPSYTKPTAVMTNTQIDTMAASVFTDRFDKVAGDLTTPPATFNPIFSSGDDEYYDFLSAKDFNTSGSLDNLENEVGDQESKIGDWKEQAEAEPDDDTSGLDLGEPITAAHSGGAFGLGDAITSFADIIVTLVTLGGEGGAGFNNLRDSVYVTAYAMNMFSYRTYNYEGKYDLLAPEVQDDVNLSNYTEKYETVATEWANEELTFTNNKTLTNQLITKGFNKAYGAELEYILYGSDTLEGALGCAFRDIYIIRLAMNTVSAFVNFYSTSKDNLTCKAVNGIAVAINGATYGIIPVALVKCILVFLLAALESIVDMANLNVGIPVELYKVEAESWTVTLDVTDEVKGDGAPGEKTPAKGDGLYMQYSDYIFLFLFCGFNNNNQGMYERLGNVIEANMQMRSDETYDLSHAHTMFFISGKMEVDPYMMGLPLASEFEGSAFESLDWTRFTFKTTRGY